MCDACVDAHYCGAACRQRVKRQRQRDADAATADSGARVELHWADGHEPAIVVRVWQGNHSGVPLELIVLPGARLYGPTRKRDLKTMESLLDEAITVVRHYIAHASR
jgi:hypothetical protein